MGVSEARSALRRARRDQLLAIVLVARASLRVRLAKQRIRFHHWARQRKLRFRRQLGLR